VGRSLPCSTATTPSTNALLLLLHRIRDFEIYKDARGKRLKNVLPLGAARTR
jgi:hypothetical protein